MLSDQESLTDTQMALIRQYVEGGGGLVATERTSLYDAWRGRRANFGLSHLLGVQAPKYSENLYTFRPMPVMPGQPAASPASTAPAPAAEAPVAPIRHTAGRGRSVYIAAVRPAIEKPSGAAMSSQYWRLPLNAQEILSEVKWAANGVSLEVKGPATLVVEPLVQGSSTLLLHLLNYDVERRPSVENVEISVRLPQGKTAASVRLYSPDTASSPTLAHASKGEWVVFTVPRQRTYSIAKIELR